MRYQVTLPYSEVCMHMRIAGKEAEVELRENGMAQVYMDGDSVSFPITRGEAGIFDAYIERKILDHFRYQYGPMSQEDAILLRKRGEGIVSTSYFTLAELKTLEAAGITWAVTSRAKVHADKAREYAERVS